MPYQSKEQPYCRMCGKPIKKHVRTVWVESTTADRQYHRSSEFSRHAYADDVRTKADCQRLTNGHVVSVNRSHKPEFIRRFGEWDGESYLDKHFCGGPCTTSFAYMMARDYPDIVSGAYNTEARKRADKEKASA